MPASSQASIPPGTLLAGKYRVTREIGRGGMAAVYECVHTMLRKPVAIKVLAPELASSIIVIERFFREARAAASIRSPHIVDVYDSGRLEDGRPFIAMELLRGESLYDRMIRIRIIDSATTVKVISQCARGLAKAHAIGIVHRDLKPENIHITKTDEGEEVIKLLDFGLAKFYAPVNADEKTVRLTREGAVFGTPAYMSPEQVKGKGSVDHRSDLWALGCITYECLTGRAVWSTEQGVAMTFASIATAAPPVPSMFRPDLPPAFDEWLLRALERDVELRFQSALDLAEALARALGVPSIALLQVNAIGEVDPAHMAAIAEELAADDVELLASPATPPLSGSRGLSPLSFPTAPSADELLPVPSNPAPSSRGASQAPISSLGVSRLVAAFVLASVAAAGGYVAWTSLRPSSLPVVASASVSPVPSSPPSASSVAAPQPSGELDEPKWMLDVTEGQRQLASGNTEKALARFQASTGHGGGAVARAFVDQVSAASTHPSALCRLVGFAHPRVGYQDQVERPSVAVTSKGAVVTWVDPHERVRHAYSVLIDPTGRSLSRARDITPEADSVQRPSLLAVGDRIVLLYWDSSGREPGVRVRWLDAEGRIDGKSTLVGAERPGDYWPTMERAQDGTFYVAWRDDRDKEGYDLFLRHLSRELDVLGPEVRATDYVATKQERAPQLKIPAVAIGQALFVAYALERGHKTLIYRMRLPFDLPELTEGLSSKAPTTPVPGGGVEQRRDRELGDVALVNEDKVDGDLPAMVCGRDGCFLAWQSASGAVVALVDPLKGLVVWRKRFTPFGSRPSLGVGVNGEVLMAFYERGKVRVARVSRDGVGVINTFGKVTGDQPRPWLAPGRAKGEWYVAWQDLEAGHTEPYVARLSCRE
jgi:serine/threonine-protein kinase